MQASFEAPPEGEVWTIGHSTHPIAEFLDILRAHRIEAIADVRRFPGSRRHPQFGAEPLADALQQHGIAYTWLADLGGRRRPDLLEPEGSAWRHPSFRAYAQYLQTEDFAQGLHALQHLAKASRTAIMCSELLWWRCHRRLVADAMLFCGWKVVHILGKNESSEHRLAPPAQPHAGGLSYRAPCIEAASDGCC